MKPLFSLDLCDFIDWVNMVIINLIAYAYAIYPYINLLMRGHAILLRVHAIIMRAHAMTNACPRND